MKSIKESVKRYESGIVHIHLQAPFSQNITQAFLLNVGSKHENSSELFGIAHFMEHMLFNGSEKYPDRERLSLIKSELGLRENAWTWYSNTVYYLTSSNIHFAKAFDILHDRVFHPTLDKKEIEKERGIILEELRMLQDEPDFDISQKLSQRLHNGTSYAHETIGMKQSIGTIDQEQLRNFHSRFYSYDNSVYMTYGNIDVEKIQDVVEERLNFATSSKTDLPSEKIDFAPLDKEKIYYDEKDIDGSIYICEGSMPPVRSLRDHVSVMMYDSLMRIGKLGRLQQKLLYENSISNGFSFYTATLPDLISTVLSFNFNRKDEKSAHKIVDELLNDFTCTQDQFLRAKAVLNSNLYARFEDSAIVAETPPYNLYLGWLYGNEFLLSDLYKEIQKLSYDQFIDRIGKKQKRFVRGVVHPRS